MIIIQFIVHFTIFKRICTRAFFVGLFIWQFYGVSCLSKIRKFVEQTTLTGCLVKLSKKKLVCIYKYIRYIRHQMHACVNLRPQLKKNLEINFNIFIKLSDASLLM